MRGLLILFLTLLCYDMYGQCPSSIAPSLHGGNKRCIILRWNSPPQSIPFSVQFNGINYNNRVFATSTSAEYSTGNNCNGRSRPASNTGTLIFGTESCSYSSGTLPVTFGSIYLEQDDGVILHWSTNSELNNDFFSIERSKDGKQWSEIGTIDGSGT